MKKVYYCNFMEQMYQWFEYRNKTCCSFSLYLIKLSLKIIGWKEQEPETKLSGTSDFQSPVILKLFTYGLKPALLISISHFSRSFNLVCHQDLREKSLSF